MKKIFTILSVVALTAVNAQNLVTNPGFEEWSGSPATPTGWWSGGITYTQSTDVVKSGTYAAGVTAPNKSGHKTINPSPDIAIDGTKTYVFSGWYLDNVPNARFKYWNQWRNSGGDTGSNGLQASDYSVDSPEWKYFEVKGVPNAGATTARPGLRVYPEGGSGGGIIYFDDIAFGVEGTMSVADAKTLENTVKFNTVVDDVLRVQTSERVTLNVYSAEGKLVSSNRVSNNDTVNMQGLVKGVYIVVVDNGGAKFSKKVVKK